MSDHSVTISHEAGDWWLLLCTCGWWCDYSSEDPAVKAAWRHGDPVPVVLEEEAPQP